jgi:hypothetical protein
MPATCMFSNHLRKFLKITNLFRVSNRDFDDFDARELDDVEARELFDEELD